MKMNNFKKVPEEMRKKYWLDKCPICGGDVVSACRCIRNERWCANGHQWRRDKDGHAIICGDNHTDIKGDENVK